MKNVYQNALAIAKKYNKSNTSLSGGYKAFKKLAISDKAFREKWKARKEQPTITPITSNLTDEEMNFVAAIQQELQDQVKHNKISVEHLAEKFGIRDKVFIKELTEFAIIKAARKVAQCSFCPDLGREPTTREKYDKIVGIYQIQPNLSQRSSLVMQMQQYSTPAPLAFLMGEYIKRDLPQGAATNIFEPTAGTGLLTIAFDPKDYFIVVNEIDKVRLEILKAQDFYKVTDQDAVQIFDVGPFGMFYEYLKFDGVIGNPPFGNYDGSAQWGDSSFKFIPKVLDHIIVLRALDKMRDTGRAAFIIGGHTKWDGMGRIQAGKNRLFINYLHRFYNVEDIINIDGHKLYSRQGTAFDVRMILINGRKAQPEGVAPLKQSKDNDVVADFDTLYNRVLGVENNEVIKVAQDIEELSGKIMKIVGDKGFNAIKRDIDYWGPEVINIDRVLATAKFIMKKYSPNYNPETDIVKLEYLCEALSLEPQYYDNFESLRLTIKKGGIDLNIQAIERLIDIGVKLPDDIISRYENKQGLDKALFKLKSKKDFYIHIYTGEGGMTSPENWSYKKIDAIPFPTKKEDWFQSYDFFIHQDSEGRWAISEGRTGNGIFSFSNNVGKFSSKKGIINSFREYMGNIPEAELVRAIDYSINKFGLSPRYTQPDDSLELLEIEAMAELELLELLKLKK